MTSLFYWLLGIAMNETKRKERALRVKKMNAVLRKLYPTARVELNYSNPWELMVAVQLSAQCTDKRVNEVTKKLFVMYPTLDAYIHAKREVFEKAIFPCGFYRNKTKNILAAARMMYDVYHGVIPDTLEELLRIPGVARKTANVVLSSLYNKTEGIAVDTHVRRFAIRFDLSDFKDPIRIERDLMKIMPKKDWWTFNHRLVHYGRYLCPARKHDCAEHPLTKVFPQAIKSWPQSK